MKDWRPWLWAALAVLPPELLAQTMGWSLVDAPYLGVAIVWWPVDLFCRLAILRSLMKLPALRQPWQALPSALAAEVLLSLRLASVALLGLAPVAALFAYTGVETVPDRLLLIGLAGLGLLPSLAYSTARALTPALLLGEPLSAGAALQLSARKVQGAWRPFLKALLPWQGAAWVLEGLAQALPEPIGLPLGVLALMLEVQGLKSAWNALK